MAAHVSLGTCRKLRVFGVAAAMLLAPGLIAPTAAKEPGTLGFVIFDRTMAVYNDRFADECPEGLAFANDEIWWRGLSKADRAKFTNNGLIQNQERNPMALRRGPNGVDVCLKPETVTDDPPLRIVEGKYSYGANLDGTLDGHATPKSCAHQKFTGVDETPGIDNQLYRLVGCIYGWRRGGFMEAANNEALRVSGLGMILIEITGVVDLKNSPDVTVTFYRSTDQFALDGAGTPIPYSSYNIHAYPDGKPVYGDSVKGSIKDGVLQTERGDIHLPRQINPLMRDAGLRLEIDPDGQNASGLLTGYYELHDYLYKMFNTAAHASMADNCPSMYMMAARLADGYPDPKTGACTAISSAFEIKARAAFIIHPKNEKRTGKVAAR